MRKYLYKSYGSRWRADSPSGKWWLEAIRTSKGYRLEKVEDVEGVQKRFVLSNNLYDLDTVEVAIDALEIRVTPPQSRNIILHGDWQLRFLRRNAEGHHVVDRLSGGQFICIFTKNGYRVLDSLTTKEIMYPRRPFNLQECETCILETGNVLLIGGRYDCDEKTPFGYDTALRKKTAEQSKEMIVRWKNGVCGRE